MSVLGVYMARIFAQRCCERILIALHGGQMDGFEEHIAG
jgi:hypothetical protein